MGRELPVLNTTTHEDVGASWLADMLRLIRITHWQKAVFQAPSEIGRRLSLAASLHQRIRKRREHLSLEGFRARPETPVEAHGLELPPFVLR